MKLVMHPIYHARLCTALRQKAGPNTEVEVRVLNGFEIELSMREYSKDDQPSWAFYPETDDERRGQIPAPMFATMGLLEQVCPRG